MNNIHPTAIISRKANLGKNITIGPYCIINENVTIDDNSNLISHVNIDGFTAVGKNCVFYPFCSIGTDFDRFGSIIMASNIEKSLLIPIFFMFDVRTAVRLASEPEPAIVGIPILWTPLFFTKSHPWYLSAEP